MKLRIKFNKKNYLKYISHLDLMRLFERSFNRVKAPIEYSQGFNPKPKISIASPLSLGIESEEEWMDIELLEKIDKEEFKENVNNILPKDIQLLETEYIEDNAPIAGLINWSVYEISFSSIDEIEKAELESILEDWISREEIFIERYRKKKRQKVLVTENIIELMENVELKDIKDKTIVLEAMLKIGETGTLRPRDFIGAFIKDNKLNVDIDSINFKRLAQKI